MDHHHIVTFRSIERSYELILRQDVDCIFQIPPLFIEQPDGTIWSPSDSMKFEGLIEMTHHYRCEIVSIDSDPGN